MIPCPIPAVILAGILSAQHHTAERSVWDMPELPQRIDALSLSPNERFLLITAYSASEPDFRIWDIEKRTPFAWPQKDLQFGFSPLFLDDHRLSFHTTEYSLARGTTVRFTSVWDLNSGEEVARLDEYRAFAVLPDGKVFVCSGTDPESLYLIDRESGRLLRELPVGNRWGSQPVEFSADGKSLAVACLNDEGGDRVVIWDVESGERKTLLGFTGFTHPKITALAFSPNGQWLAVAGGGPLRQFLAESTVWIWVVASRQPFPLTGQAECYTQITGLTFTPEGKRLLICSEKGVAVWGFPPGELLEWIEPVKGKFPADHKMALSEDGTRLYIAHRYMYRDGHGYGHNPTTIHVYDLPPWPRVPVEADE